MPDSIGNAKPVLKDWRTYVFWLLTSAFGAGGSYLGLVQGMKIEIVRLQTQVESLRKDQQALKAEQD